VQLCSVQSEGEIDGSWEDRSVENYNSQSKDLLTLSIIDNIFFQNSSLHRNEKLINDTIFFKEYYFGAPSPLGALCGRTCYGTAYIYCMAKYW